MYHPDLAPNENEFEFRNNICAQINSEYDTLIKTMPTLNGMIDANTNNEKTIYNQIVNRSEAAKKVVEDVAINIQKPILIINFTMLLKVLYGKKKAFLSKTKR